MTKIIAAILTKNEADHIGDCIKSVQWADKVILEDSHSDDGTVEIAQSLGAEIFQSRFVNFAVARQTVLDRACDWQAEWVFFIDADERATPALAEEIDHIITERCCEAVGWWVPRYNMMWGHTMRGGGWYPDYQLRLMRPQAAHYDPERQVHEIALLDGRAGYLEAHLIHYNYDSLAQFKAKQLRYLDFEARILKEKNIRPKPWTYLTMPLREFYRRYVGLKGYKDGWVGLQVCGLMGWFTFLTYRRLRQL